MKKIGLFYATKADKTTWVAEKIQKEFGTKTESDYSGRDLEVYRIFSRMNKAAQHKINPIPVCDILEEWRN